jgi:hypothetical protein
LTIWHIPTPISMPSQFQRPVTIVARVNKDNLEGKS